MLEKAKEFKWQLNISYRMGEMGAVAKLPMFGLVVDFNSSVDYLPISFTPLNHMSPSCHPLGLAFWGRGSRHTTADC